MTQKAAIYAAMALTALHFGMATRMSGFRVAMAKDKNLSEHNNQFQVAHKAQLNIAEYSAIFIPILLYIQSVLNQKNGSKELSKIGLVSIYLAVIGSYAFAYGFGSVNNVTDTNIFRVGGATSRYLSILGLLYQLYQSSKE
eukprot:UN05945